VQCRSRSAERFDVIPKVWLTDRSMRGAPLFNALNKKISEWAS
jgi:hypothetical protein